EHNAICMREGNVFDQPALVASVRSVREKMHLPEKTDAAIAIAGGHLITKRFTIALESSTPWTEADLVAAETAQLTDAASTKPLIGQWLLGTMRTEFKREGRDVGSPIGLDGRASYTLLAAYLPIENVHAKITAIAEAGFAPSRIMVEPLAVSTALFGTGETGGALPPDIFAVIDIGAGTSDIALFSPRGILGAASVPAAGDRITDAIAVRLGLATRDAAMVKRDPATTILDLWGASRKCDPGEIRQAGDEGAAHVADAVASEIRKLLGGKETLSGIILVGGGSLWPSLPALLADALKIPESRIGVRHAETIAGIEDKSGLVKGPAFLTCLGMILSSSTSFRILSFSVNGRVHLMVQRSQERRFTVADAVESSGEDPVDYFGEPGSAVEKEGDLIGGEPGGDPIIILNGTPGSLDTPIENGAVIRIAKGARGADAIVVEPKAEIAKSALPEASLPIAHAASLHVAPVTVSPVNAEPALVPLSTLLELPIARALKIRVNGADHSLADRTRSALVDGKRVTAETLVPRAATWDTSRPDWRLYELFADRTPALTPMVNGQAADFLTVIREGDEVTL
ncbi:MAG: cell division FtsA domain-containing protein, partial [Candidatus Hydrogenedentota bacterium]